MKRFIIIILCLFILPANSYGWRRSASYLRDRDSSGTEQALEYNRDNDGWVANGSIIVDGAVVSRNPTHLPCFDGISAGAIITDFSENEWYETSGTASRGEIDNDNTVCIYTSSSTCRGKKLTVTDNDGNLYQVKLDVSGAPVDGTDYDAVVFRLYTKDTDNIQYLSVGLWDRTWSYWYMDMTKAGIKDGYDEYVIPKHRFTATSASDWNIDAIVSIKITPVSGFKTTGETLEIWVDQLKFVKNKLRTTPICLHFDDANKGVYTYARPKLNEHGFRASVFVIPAYVIAGYSNNMTAVQLHELQDKGWDICNHGWNHPHFSKLTDAQVEEQMALSTKWLRYNNFRYWDLFAYPYGDFDTEVLDIVEGYCTIARTTGAWHSRSKPYPIREDPMRIESYGIDLTLELAVLTGFVDTAIENNEYLIFYMHDITAATRARFDDFIDYIATKVDSGDVIVLPFSEFMSRDLTLLPSGNYEEITTINAATYDLLSNDKLLHVTYTSTGAVTSLTIPTVQVKADRIFTVNDGGNNAGTNNITIDTEGAETIDGAATFVIDTDNESVTIYSDGANWFTK